MKTTLTAMALAAAFATPAAFAQSSDAFSGFDVTLGIAQNAQTFKSRGINGSTHYNWNYGSDFTKPVIATNYFYPVNAHWLIGVGASYVIGDQDFNAETISTGTQTKVKMKNAWGIHVKPGYALSKDVMLYGKLSYNRMKVSDREYSGGVFRVSNAATLKGWGLGFGTRVNLAQDFFMDISVERIQYSEKYFGVSYLGSTLYGKAHTTSGKILLGYRF